MPLADYLAPFLQQPAAAFGAGQPQEDPRLQDPAPAIAGAVSGANQMARGAFEQSENLRTGGEYDAGPVVNAALMGVGPSAAGIPRGSLGVMGGRLGIPPHEELLLDKSQWAREGEAAAVQKQQGQQLGQDFMPERAAAPKTIRIPLENIEHGEAAMPGGSLSEPGSQDLIEKYAGMKTPFPPIKVVTPDEPGAKFMIEDGSHRYEAAKLRGNKSIVAEVPPEWQDLPDPQLRSRAAMVEGKWAQFGDQYPEPGPPTLISKKTDKPIAGYEYPEGQELVDAEKAYWQKTPTPEVEQFLKDRALIQKDMDVNGFQPYFDPAQRAHVDPANYPPSIDTATAPGGKTNPAKPETREKYEQLYDTPAGRQRLMDAYEEGKNIPGDKTRDWYAMQQAEQAYIEHLGPVEGPKAFKTRFADAMGAVTAGSSPAPNLLMSHYANYETLAGRELPGAAYNVPYPMGGRYGQTNIDNYRAWAERGFPSWDVENPKRADFSAAFLGNPRAFTTDEVMSGMLRPTGYGKTGKAPMQTPEWYGPATEVGRSLADTMGIEPRALQDVSWAGRRKQLFDAEQAAEKAKFMAKDKTLPKAQQQKNLPPEQRKVWPEYKYEGPMISTVNQAIERTRRLTGKTPAKAAEGWVRGNAPMFGLAGAVPAGVEGANIWQDAHDRGLISDQQMERANGQR